VSRRSLITGKPVGDNPLARPSTYESPYIGSGWDTSTSPVYRQPTRAEILRENERAVERAVRREAARKAGVSPGELDEITRGEG
jgi:hypothetical protein